jgi:hypothetical protein
MSPVVLVGCVVSADPAGCPETGVPRRRSAAARFWADNARLTDPAQPEIAAVTTPQLHHAMGHDLRSFPFRRATLLSFLA